jgi:hypothetical protein
MFEGTFSPPHNIIQLINKHIIPLIFVTLRSTPFKEKDFAFESIDATQ